jgi:hypothetical protein
MSLQHAFNHLPDYLPRRQRQYVPVKRWHTNHMTTEAICSSETVITSYETVYPERCNIFSHVVTYLPDYTV